MDRIKDSELEKLLYGIQKPGQYLGGEWNEIKKDPDSVSTKVALVFPDLYEIGMSYLGQRILYHVLNKDPEVLAERVFAPWMDFENKLRANKIPLYSLENKIPLYSFDIVGFSLLYELNYSNILTILDLGQIPFLADKRDESHPLILAGGPAAFNPEPLADFIDFFVLGDGEEVFPEIISIYKHLRSYGKKRWELLKEFSKLEGIYVPSLYKVYQPSGSRLQAVRPKGEALPKIRKRVLYPFKHTPFPEEIIVPNVGIVFDRVVIEAERGCPQRCRFCQATSIYFPPRIKDVNHLVAAAKNSVQKTGYEDVSLTALSISDYPYLSQAIKSLMDDFSEQKVSLSLSALRPKGLTHEIVENILKVRKTGFTLVPEAGTDRLRRVINKNLSNEEIREAVSNAFSHGWQLLKLYFMVGLPTEREEDLQGIVDTVKEIINIGYEKLNKAPKINLSISSFIPKPHTPFQWEKMDRMDSLKYKHRFILSQLKKYRFVRFKKHPLNNSLIEAVFSRGDRRLSWVLLDAWKRGARFDSWNNRLDLVLWKEAFNACGLDMNIYISEADKNTPLPWDHIDTGIKKDHLLKEVDRAFRDESSSSCLELKCSSCQGCSLFDVYDKKYPPIKPELSRKYFSSKDETGEKNRYRVKLTKKGKARFLSHRDMISIIHRGLRRAGIPVLYSKGFHPKMLVSHLPALPLGMEGREELFEFKTRCVLERSDFLTRMNRSLPDGFKILDLVLLEAGHPSLTEDIDRIVYSLDLSADIVKDAIALIEGSGCVDKILKEKIEDLFKIQLKEDPLIQKISVDTDTNKLMMIFSYTEQKAPRPQDIIKALFPIENPVYIMVREKIILKT